MNPAAWTQAVIVIQEMAALILGYDEEGVSRFTRRSRSVVEQ